MMNKNLIVRCDNNRHTAMLAALSMDIIIDDVLPSLLLQMRSYLTAPIYTTSDGNRCLKNQIDAIEFYHI